MVRRLNIDGDRQGDLVGHGSEHRASSSIRWLRIAIGRTGSAEATSLWAVRGKLHGEAVCIGDHYRLGGALFAVTQPRVTCCQVGIRMNEPQMAALLVARVRPVSHFCVLDAGQVEAGDDIVQVAAGPQRMTAAEVNALLYMPGHPRTWRGRCASRP